MCSLFIIVIVGLALSSGAVARSHVKAISGVAAVLLLTVYLVWVVPYVRADEHRSQPSTTARLTLAAAIALLVAAGTGICLRALEQRNDQHAPGAEHRHAEGFAGRIQREAAFVVMPQRDVELDP